MSKPETSVGMPVMDGAKYTAEAIQSIIDQDYDPLEIIVVDDGSTDNTADIVKFSDDKILYTYQENKAVATARNYGLYAASGLFVAFVDSDALWHAGKLTAHAEHFSAHPDMDISICSILQYENESLITLHPGAAMISQKVFDKMGLMDKALRFAEDINWYLQAIESNIPIKVIDEVVYFYRVHRNNMTRDLQATNLYLVSAFKQLPECRRRQNPCNPRH